MKPTMLALFILATMGLFVLLGCGGDSGDDDAAAAGDDDDDDDDNDDDDSADDDDDNDDNDDNDDDDNDDNDDDDDNDDNDDDDNDDDNDNNDDNDDNDSPPPVTNEARAIGFKLFYQERLRRELLTWNRYGLAGDAAAGVNIHKHSIAIAGDEIEVIAGETDNNDIGVSIWAAWNALHHFTGRDLELTLIRMFEGLSFYEAITGHSGLTSRETLPGWTRVMDGVNGTVTRARDGTPFTPPVVFPSELEQEILDTFFDGLVVTYREDPGEYYWSFKPIGELEDFLGTYVFSEQNDFMRISNCCSSWMITKQGIWDGAYWGNHNSRDNFPDMSLGFLSAMDAASRKDLPPDVAAAAAEAAEAGHRIGDRIVADGDIQMTVPENGDYDDLIPGGQVRPDGTTEWQDLGSFSSCPMVYLAKALSTPGLDAPLPEMPLPGSIEMSAVRELFRLLGLEPPELPVLQCHSLDDSFFGTTWEEVLDFEILGRPWYEVAFDLAELFPDLFPALVGSTSDDFKEMEMGAMAVCYYAQITGKEDLRGLAKEALSNLVEIHRIIAQLAYSVAGSPNRAQGAAVYEQLVKDMEEHLYFAAFMSVQCGISAPLEDFGDFAPSLQQAAYLESVLTWGDTSPWPLITDEDIAQTVAAMLANWDADESWLADRYRARFPDAPPVRRAGDGYEAIGPDGNWQAAENPRHQWFSANDLLFDMPLCTKAPWVVSCDWAVLGCARPDLDGSGMVDAADQALFDAAFTAYLGQTCDDGNTWCEGADLDRSGLADADDQAFMAAAAGCVR